ncbi:MAG TPA: cation transporter [Clostridiales bacterium]|nr:cation transporter [Clostridiales bacterium]
MEHNHSHVHNHSGQNNIKVAFFLNLAFTLLEIAGGLWTNSMAILSDALHDLGDSISLAMAWYLQKFSQRGPDERFSYGYARFSLLGALINSFILVAGCVLVLTKTIPRILRPEALNPKGMLVFAILGVVINGVAVLRLRKGSSLNEKVVFWHLLEDVLGWAAILIVSIVLMFVNLPILDPILSIIITVYVLYNVVKNLKNVLNVFLQGVPKDLSIREIEQEIMEKTDVLSVHHTHIWSLEGQKNLLTTHVTVQDGAEQQRIIALKERIKDLMKEKGISHVTIEFEFASEDCKDTHCE